MAWQPRAILLHGFLAHEECDHIIQVSGRRICVWACCLRTPVLALGFRPVAAFV